MTFAKLTRENYRNSFDTLKYIGWYQTIICS
jgi:hypothetical protein